MIAVMQPLQVTGVIPPISQGKRLEIAREYAGLSQVELATRMGVSPGTVNRSERGLSRPRRSALILWAMATGVDLQWIENGYGPGSKTEAIGDECAIRDLNPEPADQWLLAG